MRFGDSNRKYTIVGARVPLTGEEWTDQRFIEIEEM